MSNGEEAPDGGLFKEVGGDQTSQIGTESEEEDTLEDHTSLFVKGKEGSEHQERVNGSTGNNISGVSHGNGPGKVIVSYLRLILHAKSLFVTSESAELFTSEPFSRGSSELIVPNVSHQESSEQHTTTLMRG